MKFGIRKPSLKRSLKAKTTGRAKRALKSSVNPLYGKKGMGLVNNPKKALYNKVYNKTTVSVVPKSSNSKKSIPKSKVNTDSKSTTSDSVASIVIVISFLLILFNGKPLLSKLISFVVVLFIIILFFTIISIRKENKQSKVTTDQKQENSTDNNIYEEQANLYLKQVNESIKIVNTTKNPEVFFSRYNLILERLEQLIDILTKVSYSGENAEDSLKEFQENKASTFNDFINRYYESVLLKVNSLKTEKAKINNANKFKENLILYEEYLEPENIEIINILNKKLQENVGK